MTMISAIRSLYLVGQYQERGPTLSSPRRIVSRQTGRE